MLICAALGATLARDRTPERLARGSVRRRRKGARSERMRRVFSNGVFGERACARKPVNKIRRHDVDFVDGVSRVALAKQRTNRLAALVGASARLSVARLRWRKSMPQIVVRFAADFVIVFENEADAREVMAVLPRG